MESRRGAVVASCLLLLIVLVAPSVPAPPPSGGGGGGGGPPVPDPPEKPGEEPASGPQGNGPEGGGGDPPPCCSPPPLTPLPNVTYTPPYANLTVPAIYPDRTTVGSGEMVTFLVHVSNLGYLLVETANLTLYDNVISNATAIAWTSVDLWDFENSVELNWTPMSAGNHTIIPVIDADHRVRETDESDNTRPVLVTVVGGSAPGRADLQATEADIGVVDPPIAGVPNTLQIQLWNLGTAPAANVQVDVTDNGAPVGSYLIGALQDLGRDVHELPWTPVGEGLHAIRAVADPAKSIGELRETNNEGVQEFYADSSISQFCETFDLLYVPPGQTLSFTNCKVLAMNVTVEGTLRFNHSRLYMGRPWGFCQNCPASTPFPGAPPDVLWYRVLVQPYGLLEFSNGSAIIGTSSYNGFGFDASRYSRFYFNDSEAFLPWGPRKICPGPPGGPLSRCAALVQAGLVVRTDQFSFRNSVVTQGRLHGLYLAGYLLWSWQDGVWDAPNFVVDRGRFLDNRGAGLVINNAYATVPNGTFERNRVGLYQLGAPGAWPVRPVATVVDGAFTENNEGIQSVDLATLDLLESSFGSNGLFAVRLADLYHGDAGKRDTVRASSIHAPAMSFGLYSYFASPAVENNTAVGQPRAYFVFDESPHHVDVPVVGEWPRLLGNAANGTGFPQFNAYGVIANRTTLRVHDNRFGTLAIVAAFTQATGYVERLATGNEIGGTLGQACIGVAAAVGSSLVVENNTFRAGGCGNNPNPPPAERPMVLAQNSDARIRWNNLSDSDMAVYAVNATPLVIANNTGHGPIVVNASAGPVIHNNTRDYANPYSKKDIIQVWNSPNAVVTENRARGYLATFVLNNTTYEYGVDNLIELINTPDALVERNVLTGGKCYVPGEIFDRDYQADKGLIKVYNNATAVVRYNRLRCGAWGITLDDLRPGPLTPAFRATYALIEFNSVDHAGFRAIGVASNRWYDDPTATWYESSTRGTVLWNQVNYSKSWGIGMQSSFDDPRNRVENNTIRETHGRDRLGGYGGAVTLAEWITPTYAHVAKNTLVAGNGTGILVRDDYNGLIWNNTISDFVGDGWVGNQTAKTYGEGITIQPTTVPVTAVNNTITDCAIGIMVRRGPGHVLTGNVIENRTLNRTTVGLYANETFWLLSGPATATATGNTFRNLTVGVLAGTVKNLVNDSNGWRWLLTAPDLTLTANTFTDNDVGVRLRGPFLNNTTFPITWIPGEIQPLDVEMTRNTLSGNGVGIEVLGPYVDLSPRHDNQSFPVHAWIHDNNTVTAGTTGIVLRGAAGNGTIFPPDLVLEDNNTVANFTQYGVWVDAATVDPASNLTMWWNDVRSTVAGALGVRVEGDPFAQWGDYFHAECNWWNHASGPFDPPPDNPDSNPGSGQPVSDWFWYRDKIDNVPYWLDQPAIQETECLP